MNNFIVKSDDTETISSYKMWKQVNAFRKEAKEKSIRHNDFLARVKDECPELTVQDFCTVPYNDKGQTIQAVDLNQDQMMLVGMRESKAVRRRVLEWIKSLANQVKPMTFLEYAQALVKLETERLALEKKLEEVEEDNEELTR